MLFQGLGVYLKSVVCLCAHALKRHHARTLQCTECTMLLPSTFDSCMLMCRLMLFPATTHLDPRSRAKVHPRKAYIT